jgi:phosphate-selective porin
VHAIAGNGDGFTAADIRFTTLGMGYTYYINEHIKLTLWYDRVWNERTRLPGFTQDVADNVLTTRLQYRF